MKKDFNDAIMKLEDFCKTYNALSMEDKLLFAVLGPNGSDVAATVANEISEPKDPKGGLTDEEFSKYSHFGDNDYKGTDSVHKKCKTIKVDGEEMPVISDASTVHHHVKCKEWRDYIKYASLIRRCRNGCNSSQLVSIRDESYAVVTADDVSVGIYSLEDSKDLYCINAIESYATILTGKLPHWEWHYGFDVVCYSHLDLGCVEAYLRHLEEDGEITVEEVIINDR